MEGGLPNAEVKMNMNDPSVYHRGSLHKLRTQLILVHQQLALGVQTAIPYVSAVPTQAKMRCPPVEAMWMANI